jgi:beta-lactamase regulating signal transducer with metallopeptidase domain
VRDLVVLLWLAGLVVHLVRLSLGLRQTYRLTFTGTTPPPQWLAALAREIAQRLRGQLCLVRVSTKASVPMVMGVLRPVILVPAGFVTGLPPAALRALLAHELAHVQRHDFLFNLLQVLAESLLFYRPATWWLSRQIHDEREHCCDDVASQALGDRRSLARALVAAEELRSSRSPVLALAATVVRARLSSPGVRFTITSGSDGSVMVCAMLPGSGECNADGMIWRGTRSCCAQA